MRHLFYGLVFLCSSIGISQNNHQQNYQIRYQNFVNGNMIVIGNNIVNRSTSFIPSSNPFDDIGDSVKHNDQLTMEYIDIDTDASTFCSSSASLKIPDNTKKVVYAGLYWAATYPYNRGSPRDMVRYKIEDENREAFQSVKIQTPSTSGYVDISGTIVFDGEGNDEFSEMKPYVVYADITNLFSDISQVQGTYTVANIKASQGQIPGGVAAGWTMVVVYEQEGAESKKIITYDGFKDIFRKEIEVVFEGFKTPSEGAIKIELAGSVLEGDHSIAGSQLSISTEGKKTVYLSTATRPRKNFFNSGITNGDDYIFQRKPASRNTLGYDIFTVEIPNENNELIGNDASQLILTMPASADRYYSFFTALSIRSEIIKSEEDSSKCIYIISALEEQVTNTKTTDIQEKLTENVTEIEKQIPTTNEQVTLRDLEIGELDKGFYNIVGVFITGLSAEKLKAKMIRVGFESDYLYDPASNKRYVYVYKSETFDEALSKQQELKQQEEYKDSWILSVNQNQ